jgi:hypothetical protein
VVPSSGTRAAWGVVASGFIASVRKQNAADAARVEETQRSLREAAAAIDGAADEEARFHRTREKLTRRGMDTAFSDHLVGD